EVRETVFADSLDSDKAWNKITNQIKLENKQKYLFIKILVAASILLGLLITLFLPHKDLSNQETYTSIPAGTSKAMLYVSVGEYSNFGKNEISSYQTEEAVLLETDSLDLFSASQKKDEKNIYHTLVVPKGGEYKLILPDSTKIWLNSDTRLIYSAQLTDEKREVFLEGEIYLEVSRDDKRPFFVHTHQGSIEVLGTSFNVSAYAQQENTITTLVKGSVEVSTKTEKVVLKPGQQAVSLHNASPIVVREVDVNYYTSWVKGIFEFENMALKEITDYLSRWYNIDFEFTDNASPNRRFTGGIKKYLPLEEFLAVIEQTTNVRFKILPDKVEVSNQN
ncbi:MAG: FecR domain-containing protein, partial [Odoribacter sp.]|nr:FecR domain-containing protein [Odoribacter sp.]